MGVQDLTRVTGGKQNGKKIWQGTMKKEIFILKPLMCQCSFFCIKHLRSSSIKCKKSWAPNETACVVKKTLMLIPFCLSFLVNNRVAFVNQWNLPMGKWIKVFSVQMISRQSFVFDFSLYLFAVLFDSLPLHFCFALRASWCVQFGSIMITQI